MKDSEILGRALKRLLLVWDDIAMVERKLKEREDERK